MVRGSYLLGCRVSELCRLRWEDIEPLDEGGNVRLLGKGSKPRTIRVSKHRHAEAVRVPWARRAWRLAFPK